MQQSCTYGSVRGALGNRRPYRDRGFCVLGFLGKLPKSQHGYAENKWLAIVFLAILPKSGGRGGVFPQPASVLSEKYVE